MKLLLATKNNHKRRELCRILEALSLEAVTEEELDIILPEPEETGTTFEENARLKAYAAMAASGYASVADDSGLETDYLGGAPGVYSARYAGEHGDDSKNIEKLLREMRDAVGEKRSARFVCALCAAFPDGREILVRGTLEGYIGMEPQGTNGFGYDPVFVLPDGRTAAQLSDKEKDMISHRGDALRKLREEFEKIYF